MTDSPEVVEELVAEEAFSFPFTGTDAELLAACRERPWRYARRVAALAERLASEKVAVEAERDEALRQSLTFKKYWNDEREACRKARNERDAIHGGALASEHAACEARKAGMLEAARMMTTYIGATIKTATQMWESRWKETGIHVVGTLLVAEKKLTDTIRAKAEEP